jgi:hypothetical protein
MKKIVVLLIATFVLQSHVHSMEWIKNFFFGRKNGITSNNITGKKRKRDNQHFQEEYQPPQKKQKIIIEDTRGKNFSIDINQIPTISQIKDRHINTCGFHAARNAIIILTLCFNEIFHQEEFQKIFTTNGNWSTWLKEWQKLLEVNNNLNRTHLEMILFRSNQTLLSKILPNFLTQIPMAKNLNIPPKEIVSEKINIIIEEAFDKQLSGNFHGIDLAATQKLLHTIHEMRESEKMYTILIIRPTDSDHYLTLYLNKDGNKVHVSFLDSLNNTEVAHNKNLTRIERILTIFFQNTKIPTTEKFEKKYKEVQQRRRSSKNNDLYQYNPRKSEIITIN